MKNFIFRITIAVLLLVSAPSMVAPLQAQCPMCRISAESNLKNGGKAGAGLNGGILYMLSLPYLLVGAIGLWWWRNRRKPGDDASFDEEGPNHTTRIDPSQYN